MSRGFDCPMPVPPGYFRRYAVCITEGFCPECLVPLERIAMGWSWGECPDCGCYWQYEHGQFMQHILWRGQIKPHWWWDIWSTDLDRYFPQRDDGEPRPCVRSLTSM